MKKTCKGCPFEKVDKMNNKAIEIKISSVMPIKNNMGLLNVECHKNKKTLCKGYENINSCRK